MTEIEIKRAAFDTAGELDPQVLVDSSAQELQDTLTQARAGFHILEIKKDDCDRILEATNKYVGGETYFYEQGEALREHIQASNEIQKQLDESATKVLSILSEMRQQHSDTELQEAA